MQIPRRAKQCGASSAAPPGDAQLPAVRSGSPLRRPSVDDWVRQCEMVKKEGVDGVFFGVFPAPTEGQAGFPQVTVFVRQESAPTIARCRATIPSYIPRSVLGQYVFWIATTKVGIGHKSCHIQSESG